MAHPNYLTLTLPP